MTTKQALKQLLKAIKQADQVCLHVTTIQHKTADPYDVEQAIAECTAMRMEERCKPSLN